MSSGAEVELKLRLPRSAITALREHPALRSVKRGRLRQDKLAAVYFDTTDCALARRGIALRLRRERGRWVQTVKGRGTGAGGLAQRREDQWDLGQRVRRPPLDLALLAHSVLGREVVRAARGRTIEALFITTIVRTTLPLAFADGTSAEAAIDVGRVKPASGRGGSQAICELELELRQGDVTRLFELAALLVADLPLAVEPCSKAQRGYALVAKAAAAPRHAVALDYPKTASAATAIGAILCNVMSQVDGNADGAATADDPEWIHQLRVGVRRLRSALALARPLTGEGRRSLEDEARWIAEVLGHARDLDVFVAETLPPLAAAAASVDLAGELGALADAARRRRAAVQVDVRAALRSPRFQHLLLGVGALAAAPPAGATALGASAFAQHALHRRHRQLVRAGTALEAGSADERHAVRIAAKKLRYAVEFFAPLFPGARCATYRSALTGLQEVLGRLNDLAGALAIVTADGAADSRVAALVAGWAGARTASEERELRRAWQGFRTAKLFWKHAKEA